MYNIYLGFFPMKTHDFKIISNFNNFPNFKTDLSFYRKANDRYHVLYINFLSHHVLLNTI